jgi:Mn-dependent DtxR family transcriptional regulator
MPKRQKYFQLHGKSAQTMILEALKDSGGEMTLQQLKDKTHIVYPSLRSFLSGLHLMKLVSHPKYGKWKITELGISSLKKG